MMKKIYLKQEPYVDGMINEPYYTACAEDDYGDDYTIIWDILEDYDPADACGDETDACDWSKFYVMRNGDMLGTEEDYILYDTRGHLINDCER